MEVVKLIRNGNLWRQSNFSESRKVFKDQIYQQKNEQFEIQSFAVSFNKTNCGDSSKHFERDKVSSRLEKVVYQRTVSRH